MNIGVPKERRPFEYRVGLPPTGVGPLLKHGHTVYIEHDAGVGAGFTDEDYRQAGSTVVYSPEEVFGRADLVLKFTRPLSDELQMMPEGCSLFGFLHLAAARRDKIDLMLEKKILTIAYEQVELEDGHRPIMTPLSQVGGQMAVQVAARLLQTDHGGRGILLGGVAGVPSAEVVILGAGNVGKTAATAFSKLGAQVTLLDSDLRKLQQIQAPGIVTMLSTPRNIERVCVYADVLIGAVLVPGERTPVLVNRETVSKMKPRSLIMDLSIDQGGCVETSRPTNHGSPTYLEEAVVHYCVPNMSGVLGRTATHALYIGVYPYLDSIAKHGIEAALDSIPALERGLNTKNGEILHLRRVEELKGRGQ
jgi:alanine dehydrogenase